MSRPRLPGRAGAAPRRIFLAVVFLLGAASAAAEVTLSTRVERIDAALGALPVEDGVLPGEVLRYTIVFSNDSVLDTAPGSIVITNPLPEGTEYVAGSAAGAGTVVTLSADGEAFAAPEALTVADDTGARPATAADVQSIRWTYQPSLRAGEQGSVTFDILLPLH